MSNNALPPLPQDRSEEPENCGSLMDWGEELRVALEQERFRALAEQSQDWE